MVALASAGLHAAPVLGKAAYARLSTLDAPVEARLGSSGVEAALRARDVARYLGIQSVDDVSAARAALVERARAARRSDRLELGRFLIHAATLDAFERGIPTEPRRAERAYEQRAARLAYELATGRGNGIVPLVSAVFGDLDYHGTGGSISDVLLTGGGSCEGLTHLLAAALHDSELSRYAYVRTWGGGPVGHLAPVYRVGGEGTDLLSGSTPIGGVELRADELVEVYARHHGLAPALDGPSSAGVGTSVERPTLARGYPPNADAYGGSVPLFAERAIASVRVERGDEVPVEDRARIAAASLDRVVGLSDDAQRDLSTCGVRSIVARPSRFHAWLDPAPIELEAEPIELDVEPALPLSTISALLRDAARLERRPPAAGVRGVAEAACLHETYRIAARHLAFARRPQLSLEASRRARASRELAEQRTAEIAWTDELREELFGLVYADSIAAIPAVADRLLEGAALTKLEAALPFESRWSDVVVALLDEPHAQARALTLVEAAPIRTRMSLAAVIAALHAAPSGSVQLPPESNVARAARALAHLARQPPRDLDDALRSAAEHGMPPSWIEELRGLRD